MKLQNEVSSLKTLFINELEQTSLQQTVHKWEKVLIEKSYYSILTLTKSKYFVSYIIKLQCKQGDVLGGEQDRNRQQRIFRKILTIYIRKCWSKDEFFMTLKLILDFLFTYIQIFLNILEYIWWSLQSSILFMGMSKRWRKVICVVKLSHRTTTQI